MKRFRNRWLFALALLSASTVQADATKNLEKVISSEQGAVKEAQNSQEKVDQIVSNTEKLFEEYKSINKQIDGLKVYNAQLQRQISNQESHLERIANSIDQASLMERQISPLMQKMLSSLAQFVELDLPFHRSERNERIQQLQANQERADLSVAERFRQVLEAYKIENEYGRTMDTYREVISINGQEREVGILRVGRIALLFQTPDKQVAGMWDKNSGQWKELEESHYRSAIAQGIRMANKQVSLDIMTLPVSAPEAVQ